MLAGRLRAALARLRAAVFGRSDPGSGGAVGRPTAVVGCSVAGAKHDRNEDAWRARTPTSGTLAIAVADGVGSAERGREGAAVATEAAIKELTAGLAEAVDAGPEERMQAAFAAARSALAERADELNVPIAALGTTLVAVAGDRSGTAAAAVGDGGVVGDDDGHYFPILDREAGEYANVTTPLTAPDWTDAYRFARTDRADGVAAFTDGLGNFAWAEAGAAAPETAFFEQVFPPVRGAARAGDVESKLCAFLEDEHFAEYSRDDKTLVVGLLCTQNGEVADPAEADRPMSAPAGGANR